MAGVPSLQQEVLNILELFSKESPEIRDEVASLLPSYNELLNMHALSFSEFALVPIAEEQGLDPADPLFDYNAVVPPCPKCKSSHVNRKSKFFYYCTACSLYFTPNWNSISSGCKVSAMTYLKVLRCMLDRYSGNRICKVCGIAPSTFFNIRNRLFYAMELMLQDVKLYGICRCDNTFIHTNFRGSNLSDSDFPEDCPFDQIDFVPRLARARGGSRGGERVLSSVCIFAAIDEFNHVTAKFVGVGAANTVLLAEAIGDKFLLTVPDEDPSPFPPQKMQMQHHNTSPGSASLLVSDGESAIARFAERYGITHEAHVYRRKGTQVRLSKGDHDIQRVNALHGRLKKFLRDAGCSSKYLPGYLTFFEWIENFKASDDAIRRLFLLLAAPGKGRSASFFKERFVVPNYLTQWCKLDNPLSKLPYNKILAYTLYKQRRDAIDSGNEASALPMDEIAYRTGYSKQTIRRIYKNLSASGYDALISEHFNIPKKKKTPRKSEIQVCRSISKEMLAIFDEYAQNIALPKATRLTGKAFEAMINEKYGTSYKLRNLRFSFGEIVKKGLRPPLPQRTTYSQDNVLSPAEEKRLEIYNAYLSLKQSCREVGVKGPAPNDLLLTLSEQFGLAPSTVAAYISHINSVLDKLQRQETSNRPATGKKTHTRTQK